MFKRIQTVALSAMILCMAGCGTPQQAKADPAPSPAQAQTQTASAESKKDAQSPAKDAGNNDAPVAAAAESSTHAIVVYYSRTDENYRVGNITEGNTAKVAAEIARQTGADVFEIKPVKAYPAEYKACIELAQQEKDDNARPQIATTVSDFARYNTVYLGYPIWWGDMPMVVYTFIEGQNFDGKTVIPFATHEGSGISGTPQKLRKALPKATVTEGIAITGSTAQNDPNAVKKVVGELIKQAPKN